MMSGLASSAASSPAAATRVSFEKARTRAPIGFAMFFIARSPLSVAGDVQLAGEAVVNDLADQHAAADLPSAFQNQPTASA